MTQQIHTHSGNFIKKFLAMEASGGILLMLAAILAVICANTPLVSFYDSFLKTKFTIGFGNEAILSKSLSHWINDGLMAIFFFLVGMEIKRELKEGELSSRQKAILPFFAAVGGVAAPALIFTYFNYGNEQTMSGWAIPCATDIAFAVGLLALFGSRVPLSLKVFLTAVAVIDDLMAVIIIAVFYTSQISTLSLAIAGGCALILFLMNMKGVNKIALYIVIGLVMWVAVLKSGVHATIAGVVLGFMIPLNVKNPHGESMLKACEHGLHHWVAFCILPVFAFANAGVKFDGITFEQLKDPVPVGIAAGLFFGKQIGIFTTSYLMVKAGFAQKPAGANWIQLYGICIMCGIGFTMSLFIGDLAYRSVLLETETKLGVMIGSLASGIVGYIFLNYALKKGDNKNPVEVMQSSTA